MATISEPPSGVEFVHEEDGRVTVRHVESGVASFGETEAEALRELALTLYKEMTLGKPPVRGPSARSRVRLL